MFQTCQAEVRIFSKIRHIQPLWLPLLDGVIGWVDPASQGGHDEKDKVTEICLPPYQDRLVYVRLTSSSSLSSLFSSAAIHPLELPIRPNLLLGSSLYVVTFLNIPFRHIIHIPRISCSHSYSSNHPSSVVVTHTHFP